MTHKTPIAAALLALLFAGTAQETIPLTGITLYSSGVGFFEHTGALEGPADIALPFNIAAVNDALKSLTIADPASQAPWVTYPSERTLTRALESLKIDLSRSPDLPAILEGQRGAEIVVHAPSAITGRILGVERRFDRPAGSLRAGEALEPGETFLLLAAPEGLRAINLREIDSFSFTDPAVNADLHRALDMIMAGRDDKTKTLTLRLPGTGSRQVSLSYVIPAPVWKAAYRLDLGSSSPVLQGWAIVDNDGDTDWNKVRLSLVTGRPVSFIQNLYAPYYQYRPIVPLAIAGAAEAQTYDSGYAAAEGAFAAPVPAPLARNNSAMKSLAYAEAAGAPVTAGVVETADAQALGDQFEFTFKAPVTLGRQESALFPLVEGAVRAEKFLVLSGAKIFSAPIHPAITAELTNTTGMKLPAGPVTVYDAGSYAGDALIEFFPENDKRLVSYGEDLSVTGSAGRTAATVLSAVKVSKGVMTFNRKRVYERTYTVKNAASQDKQLIIEHPLTPGAALAEPASFKERTDSVYRFALSLPGGKTTALTIREEAPLAETLALANLSFDTLLLYSSSQEIPQKVKDALKQGAGLKLKADEAAGQVTDLRGRRVLAVSEQDRIRRNLEAAGAQSPQGQEYLRRLIALDAEIDSYALKIDSQEQEAKAARDKYAAFLTELEL